MAAPPPSSTLERWTRTRLTIPTSKATAATWPVGADIESLVQALKDKGVAFEHYDFPGMARQGDLHVAGGMKVAWFKDPDGNIHSLINR